MKRKRFVLVAGILGAFALVAAAARTLRAIELKNARGPVEMPAPRDLANHDRQIAAYSHALKVDPQSAISLGMLAGLYLQRARETGNESDYFRAEQFAKRSLALRVNRNAKTFVTLSTTLMAQHRFAEAEQVARLAVEYDPSVPQYLALLAEAQLELGNYAGARQSFKALSSYRSNLSIAPRLARWEELTGDTDEAFRLLRKSTAAADTRQDIPTEQLAWFHFRLGDIEMRNGKFRRARSEFDRGLEIEPSDYRLLGGLAKLSLLEGDADRAIAFGERGIALKLDPATLGILGEAFLLKGDTAAAEENLKTMEIAVRGQPGAYHRAWSLFLLDHGRRLEEVHQNAIAELTTRQDIYGYDILAWSSYRLGRYEEAAESMRLALQLGTKDPILYYHAGMIERALKHEHEAKLFLEAALRINSRFDYRQSRIAQAALDSLRERGTP